MTGAASEGLIEIELDGAVCVGVGQCELLEPEVFRVDDDGVSVLIGEPRLTPDRAARVVEACPSGAIRHRPPEP